MKKSLKIAIVSFFILLLLALGLRLGGYRFYRYVQARNSMSPTISPGDLCLCIVNKKYTSEDLKRGRIILFEQRGYSHFLTKRIIGIEGDFVRLSGKETYVNQERLVEPYADLGPENKSYGDITEYIVPKNKLFVLGDNRPHSLDSRYSEFGLVDVRQVVGKPLLVLFSKDKRKIFRRLTTRREFERD